MTKLGLKFSDWARLGLKICCSKLRHGKGQGLSNRESTLSTPGNWDLDTGDCPPRPSSASPAQSEGARGPGFTSGEEGKGPHHRKQGRCCVIAKELKHLDLVKCRTTWVPISGKPRRMRRTTSPSEVCSHGQELQAGVRNRLGPGGPRFLLGARSLWCCLWFRLGQQQGWPTCPLFQSHPAPKFCIHLPLVEYLFLLNSQVLNKWRTLLGLSGLEKFPRLAVVGHLDPLSWPHSP